jgi:hypothetical protein
LKAKNAELIQKNKRISEQMKVCDGLDPDSRIALALGKSRVFGGLLSG